MLSLVLFVNAQIDIELNDWNWTLSYWQYALGCAGFGKHNKSLLDPVPRVLPPPSPPTLMENLLERGPPGNPFSFGKYLREKLKFDSERSYEGR
ncbi:unnamed protein product [Euphydryas editha]|uniref:Uncharacterized protein n=1 Tax=Euphydryas editha TaxID=104508 RepID=A0AAU9TW35_EUPED|nr:unnamed protein product [Euphydryas editha]